MSTMSHLRGRHGNTGRLLVVLAESHTEHTNKILDDFIKMKISKFMARQYAHPSGLFGRIVTSMLAQGPSGLAQGPSGMV